VVGVVRDVLGGAAGAAAREAFSLADPEMAERLLVGAGFGEVRIMDVREPVYYGPDPQAACEAIRGAARDNADGVWFDSRAWIISAEKL
jgi:hypothetical protein